MLKKNKILLLILICLSCDNKQKKTIEHETYVCQYQKDDLIGLWNVFHIEIVKGRYTESSKNPVLYKDNFVDDSFLLEFREDLTFFINKKLHGNWYLKNDSIAIINNDTAPFPVNINAKYKIHKGYFDKNWYLYTSFYNKSGQITHSLRVIAKRIIPK